MVMRTVSVPPKFTMVHAFIMHAGLCDLRSSTQPWTASTMARALALVGYALLAALCAPAAATAMTPEERAAEEKYWADDRARRQQAIKEAQTALRAKQLAERAAARMKAQLERDEKRAAEKRRAAERAAAAQVSAKLAAKAAADAAAATAAAR